MPDREVSKDRQADWQQTEDYILLSANEKLWLEKDKRVRAHAHVFLCVCASISNSLMMGTVWQSSCPPNVQRQYSTRCPLHRSQVSPTLCTADVSLSTQCAEKTYTNTQIISIQPIKLEGTENIITVTYKSSYTQEGTETKRNTRMTTENQKDNKDGDGFIKEEKVWWGLTGCVIGRWRLLDMNNQKRPSSWLPVRLTSVRTSPSLSAKRLHLQ